MGHLTKEEVLSEAAARRERILTYITQDPPVPLANICVMEGMAERACRALIKSLEQEHSVDYFSTGTRRDPDEMPYGLTDATRHLRQRLADCLYQLRERGNDGNPSYGRSQLCPRVGLNIRQQRRAENKPFAHDWKLSEIERLAREIGRDPVELLLSCLKT